jgi:hypothetical protein
MAGETPTHPEVHKLEGSKELVAQTAYSHFVVGPALDNTFDPPYVGIEVTTDGNVEIVTADGTSVLPAATGRIYPIEIHQLKSNNTAVNTSEIILYRK